MDAATKTKRTAYVDDRLLELAGEMLDTSSTTAILNEALRRLVVSGRKRKTALGASLPEGETAPIARNADDALSEAGFGVR